MTKKYDENMHSKMMQNYSASYGAEKEQRDLCIEDLRFCYVEGSQWDDTASNARSDRPMFEINKVALPVNQCISEQRQNRISIKVRPTSDGASKDVADLFSGLIRDIETQSDFKETKDITFKHIAAGGMGAWYVTTDYVDDSFDQQILIKAIPSAASSVFYDTSSTDPLKRDANWVMVTQDVDKKWFETKYPDCSTSNFNNQSGATSNWQSRDTIRIADYWVKTPVQIELALLSDGRTVTVDDNFKQIEDELALTGVTVVKTRKRMGSKVEMYKISASEIIEGPLPWAGKYIPVVPIFGYSIWIDGQHFYKGMVRDAKDPQRVYNYATSQAIEVAALSPKDPIWITPEQAKGHEKALQTYNQTNAPFMLFNPDPLNPGIPQRGGAPSVQGALIAQIQQADMDLQATTGAFSPTLGDATTDQSGRAILALQRQSNLSTYELVDNLVKGVEWTGAILIDLIPKIYDTQRQVAVMSEDGQTAQVTINQTVVDQQTGQPVIINDLNVGRYDVITSSGPSYSTKRSEGLNLLTKLAETNPVFSNISADLIAKSVDFDFSEELTKRVRKQMLNQGLVDPNEQEMMAIQQQGQPQPSAMDLLAFETKKLQLELLAGQVDYIEVNNMKTKADYSHKVAETQKLLTEVLKLKTQINSELDKQGKPIDMPVEAEELHARTANMRLLNDSLQLSEADVAKTHANQVEDFVDKVQLQNQPQIDDSQKVGMASQVAMANIPTVDIPQGN